MNLFHDLTSRGLVEQTSDPAIEKLLGEGPGAQSIVAYSGFDPSGNSLHIGNLVPLLGLIRLARAGHKPIALVGGATGLIGDPSGKSQERVLKTDEEIAGNVAGIRRQLERVFAFAGAGAPRVLNNADWFRPIGFLAFLRDVGKHFSVNAMIAKDSVRVRLEERDQGISFTEFSYMLLQAYDFLWLFEHEDCSFQFGGSDQWGNITAGIELIRRKLQRPAMGFTMPLITTADGKKFGKTEQGAVWLDPDRTKPFELRQYFLNTDDRDVARYLRYFTLLPLDEIDELVRRSDEDRGKREAQRVLAREVTRLVHGPDEAERAEKAAVFGGGKQTAEAIAAPLLALKSKADFEASGIPGAVRARGDLPRSLVQLLCDPDVALCDSLGAARRDIGGGGIYVNEIRVDDLQRQVTVDDIQSGRYILLRKGKKNQRAILFFDGAA